MNGWLIGGLGVVGLALVWACVDFLVVMKQQAKMRRHPEYVRSRDELTNPVQIWWNHVRRGANMLLGDVANAIGVPGFVREMEFFDKVTETRVRVRIDNLYTVISIGPRDYFFNRLSGKDGGTGYAFCRED